MTQTLTTEALRALRDSLKSWQDGYDPVDDKEQYEMFVTAETAVGELLANREAQPVAVMYKNNGDVLTKEQCGKYFDICCKVETPLFTAPPAPAYPETLPCAVRLMPGIIFGEGVRTSTMLDGLRRREEYNAEMAAMTPEQKAEHDAGLEEFKSMLLSRSTPAPAVPNEKAITPFFDTMALDTAKMVMCDVNRRSDFLGGDTQLLARIQCRVDEACRDAILAQPVTSGYKLVPVELLSTASSLIDLCRTHTTLSSNDNYKERTIIECNNTMQAIAKLLAAAPEGGNDA